MKSFLPLLLSAVLLAGCGKSSKKGAIPAPNVPASSQVAHYEQLVNHLDLGGPVFGYIDLQGDVQRVGSWINDLFAFIKEIEPEEIPFDIDAAKIITELGLDNINGVGWSSYAEGDFFHNKLFLSIEGERQGLLKILGGKPHALEALTLAPSDAHYVIQSDLDAVALYDVIMKIVKEVEKQTGENLTAQVEQTLQQPLPPLGMTGAEIIPKLNTRYTLIARLDGSKKIAIPESDLEVPQPDIVITMDGMGWLVAKLKETFAEMPFIAVEETDEALTLSSSAPLPPPFDVFEPVLVQDKKSDRLILTTRKGFWEECQAGKNPLHQAALFSAAGVDADFEGNALEYLSPETWPIVRGLISEIIGQSASAKEQKQMEKALGFLTSLLPMLEKGYVSTSSNLDDGVLVHYYAPQSHKSTLFTAPLAMIFSGTIGGVMEGMQERALEEAMGRLEEEMEEEGVEMEEEAPEPNLEAPAPEAPQEEPAASEPEAAPAPEAKAKHTFRPDPKTNLRQIHIAALVFFADNPEATSAPYEMLVEKGVLPPLEIAEGESYLDLVVFRQGGVLEVTNSDGDIIRHQYPAAP